MLRLFGQLILRHLRSEVLRTAITVIGVAAGIAVVLAIRLTNASAVRGFQAALDLTSGRAGLEIIGAGFGIDERVLPQLDWLREFGVTSPVIDGDVLAVVGSRQSAVGSGGGRLHLRASLRPTVATDPADSRRLLLEPSCYACSGWTSCATSRCATTRSATPAPAPPPQTASDILGLLTDPTAAVITRAFADRHGLKVGDPLPVIVSDRPRQLRVRALLEAEGPAKLLDGNFLLMDIAAAQWAFERLGQVDRIDVKLHDGVDIAAAEAAIASRLPRGSPCSGRRAAGSRWSRCWRPST